MSFIQRFMEWFRGPFFIEYVWDKEHNEFIFYVPEKQPSLIKELIKKSPSFRGQAKLILTKFSEDVQEEYKKNFLDFYIKMKKVNTYFKGEFDVNQLSDDLLDQIVNDVSVMHEFEAYFIPLEASKATKPAPYIYLGQEHEAYIYYRDPEVSLDYIKKIAKNVAKKHKGIVGESGVQTRGFKKHILVD